MPVTAEKMALYRATAQQRQQTERAALRQRRERAWQLARDAAALLREKFAVNQVIAFGSLLDEMLF